MFRPETTSAPHGLPLLQEPQSGRKLAEWLFFGLLLALGTLLVADYGVSWDETNNHLNGLVNLKYLASLLPVGEGLRQHPTFASTPDIRDFFDAHHGPLFEMAAVVVNYLFTDHDSRSYFLVRHLMVFGVFVAGVWALYQLARRWLGSWRWGLLAAALLVASPRFFAEAFYNGKDIVFMACFTLAMHTLARLLARPTPGRALVHGLAIALAAGIRVQGLQLLLFTALGLALTAVAGQYRLQPAARPAYARIGALVVVAALGGLVSIWPYLWVHSLPKLLDVSAHAMHYPWKFTNLYWGQFYKSAGVPWHYVPVWLLITTPVGYSVAAAMGLGAVCWRWGQALARRVWPAGSEPALDALVATWLLGPIGVVILMRASIYDGWRHLYFVYPALVLLAARGVHVVWRRSGQRGRGRQLALAGLAVFGLATAHTVWRMVRMHPFQNLYFSFLSAPAAERLFERDYWGLSYRRGLEWLLANQPTGPIRINATVPNYYPLYNNSLMLPATQRHRIQYVPLAEADYFMGAYRWHPQAYPDTLGTEIYTLRVEGIRTLSIFRRPRAGAARR
ncbi:glycosyltransferase family 39 protein [Hymenobacter terrestris]|uniref:Glycosyltransferase family 39 protein n=1 Tax=Hymenobacter terrestris TaxID=2748310 RepID=A0ABX2Q1T7_9BACT|nr:glycosyltransferase family 39 protein [Hymenobacter terrestris]NVO84922.1 glycosyltransferase family 39 protein [Hymenobacter terrestris]